MGNLLRARVSWSTLRKVRMNIKKKQNKKYTIEKMLYPPHSPVGNVRVSPPTFTVGIRVFAMKEFRGRFLRDISTEETVLI